MNRQGPTVITYKTKVKVVKKKKTKIRAVNNVKISKGAKKNQIQNLSVNVRIPNQKTKDEPRTSYITNQPAVPNYYQYQQPLNTKIEDILRSQKALQDKVDQIGFKKPVIDPMDSVGDWARLQAGLFSKRDPIPDNESVVSSVFSPDPTVIIEPDETIYANGPVSPERLKVIRDHLDTYKEQKSTPKHPPAMNEFHAKPEDPPMNVFHPRSPAPPINVLDERPPPKKAGILDRLRDIVSPKRITPIENISQEEAIDEFREQGAAPSDDRRVSIYGGREIKIPKELPPVPFMDSVHSGRIPTENPIVEGSPSKKRGPLPEKDLMIQQLKEYHKRDPTGFAGDPALKDFVNSRGDKKGELKVSTDKAFSIREMKIAIQYLESKKPTKGKK